MHILMPRASQGGFPVRFKIALGHLGLPQGLLVSLRGALEFPPEVENDPTWLQSSSKSSHVGMKIFHFQSIKCNSLSAVPIHITSSSHPRLSLWNDFNICIYDLIMTHDIWPLAFGLWPLVCGLAFGLASASASAGSAKRLQFRLILHFSGRYTICGS